MIYTNNYSSFPDQIVPESVKNSEDYGLQVGRAIEGEWFRNTRGTGYRYATNFQNYHRLRLYARGEQPVQKYKDELAIDGDLSYLNLDWQPVPVISKFVDIVVNGISSRNYDINAFAQDPTSIKERTDYANKLDRDLKARSLLESIEGKTGIGMRDESIKKLGIQTTSDLKLHLQLDYKQSIEIAQEELISNVMSFNKYDLVNRRINYDLCVLGIGAVKTSWDKMRGVRIEYVDPANLVYSYTEDPNFEDLYYVGEVKPVALSELKTEFPDLTKEELEQIQKYHGNSEYLRGWNGRNDDQTCQVLYFEYKTFVDQVFKLKKTKNGLEKIVQKSGDFNPPKNDSFKKVSRSIEVIYSGAKILGHPLMLDWKMAENMTRPLADKTRVHMNYNICAPRMYKGRIESLVGKITGFADMIQLTHLKIQQVLSRVVPDGVYLDVDGLAEVDLGNGTNYNPSEALNMYFQTGSIVGRSLTQDGEINHGKVPIQELQTGSGQQKMSSLIGTYQYYLQMIRDVTGLNEARDGSMPDKQSLVGLQKLAAANSNVATRHILQSSLFLTVKTAENVCRRVVDSLEFPLLKQALESSISVFNVKTLEEISDKTNADFGIFLELEPDEEEKAMLEQNIQMALQQQQIFLEDAIDIREVRNLKLANQILKQRRIKKQEQDQKQQQQMIEAQAQANAQTTEAAAMAEVQKQQALAETQIQVEQAKSEFETQRMQAELQIKQQLAQQKFEFDMKLAQADIQVNQAKEKDIEDRKDQRTRIQASQQSKMISQRQNDSLPTDFEQPQDVNIGGLDLSGV
tara:strand:+ start:1089 stop:3488 length:2400 start_codon:yes stop_codon:yes gene_type:complete